MRHSHGILAALKLLCAVALDRVFRRLDYFGIPVTLRFKEGQVSVDIGTDQLKSYWAIFIDHEYERIEGFMASNQGVVIDVGANIGMFAVRQAWHNPSIARIYCFEPNPFAFVRLCHNIILNKLDSLVIPVPRALANKDGFMPLEIPKIAYTCGAHLAQVPSHHGHALTVECCRLDSFMKLNSITSVELLKIDVEGGELDVLLGAQEALEICHRVIVECHNESNLERVTRLLSSKGFEPAGQYRKGRNTTVAYFARRIMK